MQLDYLPITFLAISQDSASVPHEVKTFSYGKQGNGSETEVAAGILSSCSFLNSLCKARIISELAYMRKNEFKIEIYDLDDAFQLHVTSHCSVLTNSSNTFIHRTVAGLHNLDSLGLAHNHLREVPARVFSHLSQLNSLELDGNQIAHIDADAFVGLEGKPRAQGLSPSSYVSMASSYATCALPKYKKSVLLLTNNTLKLLKSVVKEIVEFQKMLLQYRKFY